MSTSDPSRPSVDETPDASTTTSAAAATPGTTADAGPSTDTGRHAVVRPAPTPPPDSDGPRTESFTPATGSTGTPGERFTPATGSAAPLPTTTSAPAPGTAESRPTTSPAATAPGTTDRPAAPATPGAPASAPPAAVAAPAPAARADADDETLFPAPNAPRSTSFGAHVVGAIIGVLLAPAGIGLLLVGQARILVAQVDGWDGSTEVLGIVLVTIGLLLLGLVALLGIWSAAVPIAGGALLTAVGGFYLFAPSVARAQTLDVLSDTGWRLTVTQVTVAGTSGTLLVAGFLVLLVGVVAAVARRRGVRLGEFRERHRV